MRPVRRDVTTRSVCGCVSRRLCARAARRRWRSASVPRWRLGRWTRRPAWCPCWRWRRRAGLPLIHTHAGSRAGGRGDVYLSVMSVVCARVVCHAQHLCTVAPALRPVRATCGQPCSSRSRRCCFTVLLVLVHGKGVPSMCAVTALVPLRCERHGSRRRPCMWPRPGRSRTLPARPWRTCAAGTPRSLTSMVRPRFRPSWPAPSASTRGRGMLLLQSF
jgi:hypothetical protein